MMASPDTALNVAIPAQRARRGLTRLRASRSRGRTIDMSQVGVFHIDADRRVTEAWIVSEDQRAGDEFFA